MWSIYSAVSKNKLKCVTYKSKCTAVCMCSNYIPTTKNKLNMTTAVIAPVGQESPSLHPPELESASAPTNTLATNTDALQDNMAKRLLAQLNKQSYLVVDFSSLKACLNPLGIGEVQDEVRLYIAQKKFTAIIDVYLHHCRI